MLIGISGKKQCGKDTICNIIKALDIYYNCGIYNTVTDIEFVLCFLEGRTSIDVNSKWERHAFADKLKQAVGAILGTAPSNFEVEEFKKSYSSITKPSGGNYTRRELLQKFGTEVGRVISPNLWVDVLMADYEKGQHYSDYARTPDGSRIPIGKVQVIPHWIISDVRFPNEAQAIKEHDGILIRVNRDTGYNDTHPSEVALDNYSGFDYVIDNCDLKGTITKVRDILRDNNLI